jgi:hypothetical protein
MLACRQLVGIVTLAPQCASPCPASLSFCIPRDACTPADPEGAGTRIAFLLVHKERSAEMP